MSLHSAVKIDVHKTKNCCKQFWDYTKKTFAKRSDDIIKPNVAWNSTLVLLIESFYELLTCTAISMGMFQIRSYWNTADKISVVYSFFTMTILIVFLLMNAYFTFITSKKLTILHLYKRKE